MIRRAATGDARAIAEVQTRSWEAAYRSLLPDAVTDAHTVESRLQYWVEAVDFGPPYATWVADRSGRVAGFAHVGPNRDDDLDTADVGELWGMYVDPDSMGRGLGRALMEVIRGHFRDEGLAAATLWVLRDNARARRFYETAGWRADGAVKTEHSRTGDPIHEVRYRWEVA